MPTCETSEAACGQFAHRCKHCDSWFCVDHLQNHLITTRPTASSPSATSTPRRDVPPSTTRSILGVSQVDNISSSFADSTRPTNARSRPHSHHRVASKHLCLTYSYDLIPDQQELFEFLRHVYSDIVYVCVVPSDDSSSPRHLNVFVEFSKKKDLQNLNKFTFRGAHASQVRSINNPEKWRLYILTKHPDALFTDRKLVPLDIITFPIGKRKKLHDDHLWSERELSFAQRGEVKWPITLPLLDGTEMQLEKPVEEVKRRSWWVNMPPNSGKTTFFQKKLVLQKVSSFESLESRAILRVGLPTKSSNEESFQ